MVRGRGAAMENYLGNSLEGIDQLGQTRNLSGGGIFVKYSFGVGFLDKWDCLMKSFLGTFDIFLLNSDSYFLDSRLDITIHVEISKSPFLTLSGPFNC